MTDESVLETDSLVRFLKARNFNVQAAFAMWEVRVVVVVITIEVLSICVFVNHALP